MWSPHEGVAMATDWWRWHVPCLQNLLEIVLCAAGESNYRKLSHFGSCLEAAHWEAGRSHLLGDALPMAFLMKSLHGCTRAGQWVLLDPCTLRVECGRNKGTMPTKPHGLKGSRGKSSHSPEWGLYFFSTSGYLKHHQITKIIELTKCWVW